MSAVDTLETVLALGQTEELIEPSTMRAFETESIHQLLDDLLGDFEQDDSLMCL